MHNQSIDVSASAGASNQADGAELSVAGVLGQAAGRIERDGWARGAFYTKVGGGASPVCAAGAIRLVAVGFPDEENELSVAAEAAFSEYLFAEFGLPQSWAEENLTVIARWNDHPNRTADQVVAVLRTAAKRVA